MTIELSCRDLEQALMKCSEMTYSGVRNGSFKLAIPQRSGTTEEYLYKTAIFVQTVDGWVMRIEE
ncbi:hypothetical protein Barba3A_gp028 [Rheinheimera phage vB_RspM_Barba3A]|uniref:Uncharacterized protein n=1 Tax=Rheinheimera phage vB_RspM_Barba3A TaxID=2565687 RepID=A0A4P8MWQ9_9CAUD|nr:hypothetical protein Barba3A_gp028 [Rheinheimera phage vB_RspM_Barba3A]